MAICVSGAFSIYKNSLNIPDRQSDLVAKLRSRVVSEIKDHLFLHPQESMLVGSYARDTMIRYLNEGDVDVMVLLHYINNIEWDNPAGIEKVLDCFKDILDKTFPSTRKWRERNCISMQYDEFTLDVIPAFYMEEDGFKIPDIYRKCWLPANPVEFANKITALNDTMEGTFIPLIKMVKGWNRNEGRPLRGFHLECILYDRYHKFEKGYAFSSLLRYFFEGLPGYLQYPVYDPVTNDRVDEYLDTLAYPSTREIVLETAERARKLSAKAFDNDEKPAIAITNWKYLFGEFFPSYG